MFMEEVWRRGYADMPRYEENRDAYNQFLAHPTPWPFPEPVKDEKASQMRLKNKVSTHQDESIRHGTDWRSVMTQIAREEAFEKKVRKKAGLDEPAEDTGNENQES